MDHTTIIQILIDIGSTHNFLRFGSSLDIGTTHNFLDLEVAKNLGCKLEPVPPMTVPHGAGNEKHAPFLFRKFSCKLKQNNICD